MSRCHCMATIVWIKRLENCFFNGRNIIVLTSLRDFSTSFRDPKRRSFTIQNGETSESLCLPDKRWLHRPRTLWFVVFSNMFSAGAAIKLKFQASPLLWIRHVTMSLFICFKQCSRHPTPDFRWNVMNYSYVCWTMHDKARNMRKGHYLVRCTVSERITMIQTPKNIRKDHENAHGGQQWSSAPKTMRVCLSSLRSSTSSRCMRPQCCWIQPRISTLSGGKKVNF